MPALPLKTSAGPDTKIVFETSRPHNAHPKLPVHLERVEYERLYSGGFVKTGRREWVGSYATEELAQGEINKRSVDRDEPDFLGNLRASLTL